MARRSTQANAYAIDQITSFNGGLNTEDPVVIEDNELTQADNVVYTLQGRVTPRPGVNKRYASDFATDPVVGLSPYYRTDGTSKLVIASGTNLYTDNPHLIYNYDSQSDWKNTDAKYNADLDTSPGDVVIPTVFTEDFTEGNFLRFKTADSGWIIDNSTGTNIAKGTGTQQKLIYELSSSEGYSSVYTKVVCQFAEANQQHFPVMFNTPSGTTVQAVVADSDGHFKYHNGTALTKFPTDMVYTNGTWYTIEVWVSQGYFWVTINGLSLSSSGGVLMKDTTNNTQTLIQQLQLQNAGTTSATMWVSGIMVNPTATAFVRTTSAYKSDGTQVTANTPRYETMDRTYTETTSTDFAQGTLTNTQSTTSGLSLSFVGTSYTDNANANSGFSYGTFSNTISTPSGITMPSVNAPTFTRSSVAYKSDGTQVAANTPRYEAGRFGNAIMIEEGTTNLNSDPFFKTGVSGWGNVAWETFEWLSSEYNPFSKQNGAMHLYDNAGVTGFCAKSISISNTTYTVSVLLKIIKGNINNINVGGTIYYTDNTYTDYTWDNSNTQRQDMTQIFGNGVYKLTATITPDSNKTINRYELRISHSDAIETELYIYVVQLEQKPYATSFIDGTRAAETLTIPTAGVLNPQEGTVEFYHLFRSDSAPNPWLFGCTNANYSNTIAITKPNANTLRFRVIASSGTSTIEAPITDGWHYVVATWSVTSMNLYIDGVKAGTVANPYLPSQLENTIGVGYNPVFGNVQYCNSLIDNLRISNRARTDEEILEAYASGQLLPVDEWTTYKLTFDSTLTASRGGSYYYPVQNISSVNIVNTATLSAFFSVPLNTSLTPYYSLSTDGGNTWSSWHPFGSYQTIIPKGTNVSNYRLQWKAIFSTNNSTVAPTLTGVTTTITPGYYTSGTRVTPAIPCGVPGQASTAKIDWAATTPTNTAVTVEISWDNGQTWTTCTNHAALPGVSGLALQSSNFMLRETLTTSDIAVTPTLSSLTITFASASYSKALLIETNTTNLVTNGSFENGSTGWTLSSNMSVTNTNKYFGSYCLLISNPASTQETDSSVITVLPNTTYTFSVWIYNQMNYPITFDLKELDTTGSVVKINVNAFQVNPNSQWAQYTYTFTTSTTTAQVVIRIVAATATGSCYIDGVQLEQTSYATTYIDSYRAFERVVAPIPVGFNTQEGTIKFWLKPISLNTGGNPYIGVGGTFNAPNTTNSYYIAYNGSSLIALLGNGTGTYSVSTYKPYTNVWTHIAMTWKANDTLKLYVNGSLVAQTSIGTLSPTFQYQYMFIGTDVTNVMQANAYFSNVQVYKRVLSDAEISADFLSLTPPDWDVDTIYLLPFNGDLNLPANRQGYWLSPVVECNSGIDYQSLRVSWTDTENINSTLVALVVTSDDPSTLSWNTPYVLVNGELIDSTRLTLKRYVQVKFILQLINNGDSPVLHSATITWGANPTVSLLTSGLSAASNYSFCQLMDKLVICNGVDVPKAYDGTTVTDITNAPRAYLTCVYKNRVFMAKTDQDRSSIWFSGIQNVTDWTSQDAGVIAVNPNDGDEIMAFLPTSTLLIIAKQRACYYLQGYSPDTFQISVAGIGGAISPYGIIQTPYGIFRLDEDGVWATDFRKQVLITKKIQRIWDNLNHKIINKAALYYYKDNLLVSVAEAGSFYNNLLLVYDLIHKAWSVWRNLDASILTEFREYGEVHYLYGSSSSGNVFEIDGNSDSGVPVTGTITTKNFAYVTENFIKRAKWIDISFGNTNSNLNSNVTVTVLVDGTTTKTYQFTVPANTVSKTYRVYPPPFGSTIGVQLSLTGTAVLHSIAITYYPRVPRPQRIV